MDALQLLTWSLILYLFASLASLFLLGLDRLAMLLAGENSIREVMAFPKNQNAQCLVTSAPGMVDEAQLAELGISTK